MYGNPRGDSVSKLDPGFRVPVIVSTLSLLFLTLLFISLLFISALSVYSLIPSSLLTTTLPVLRASCRIWNGARTPSAWPEMWETCSLSEGKRSSDHKSLSLYMPLFSLLSYPLIASIFPLITVASLLSPSLFSYPLISYPLIAYIFPLITVASLLL